MAHDTSRRALRDALPPFLFGFSTWIVSVGLHAVAGIDLTSPLSERLALDRVAAALGALAAGLVLVGASLLVRARVSNRLVPSALAFFLFWLSELVLRLWTLAAGPERGFDLLAARILLAALAMLCLARAMYWIASEGRRRTPLATWSATGRWFALQLLLAAVLWYALRTDLIPPAVRDAGLFDATLWLLLTAPYAHAYVSLQRTARFVAATETLAEMLRS